MSNPLKNTHKIQGGLAHQKCYARVQPGHSVGYQDTTTYAALQKSEPESNGYVPHSHSSSMNYKETAMKPSKATQANPV